MLVAMYSTFVSVCMPSNPVGVLSSNCSSIRYGAQETYAKLVYFCIFDVFDEIQDTEYLLFAKSIEY